MGNTCIPVVDSCWYMAKPIQYCKVKKRKIKKKKDKTKTKQTNKTVEKSNAVVMIFIHFKSKCKKFMYISKYRKAKRYFQIEPLFSIARTHFIITLHIVQCDGLSINFNLNSTNLIFSFLFFLFSWYIFSVPRRPP